MIRIFAVILALIVASSPLALSGAEHTLKSVSCEPECGFSIKSHDEKELVSFVQMHAKKAHGKDVSEMDVKKMMKEEKVEHMKKEEKKPGM